MLNFNLNYEGFENHLIGRKERDVFFPYRMVQYVFEFRNGYGASVVKSQYTYGGSLNLWELGVLKFNEDGEFYLTYDTDITGDVKGYLTDEDVRRLLKEIKELEAHGCFRFLDED